MEGRSAFSFHVIVEFLPPMAHCVPGDMMNKTDGSFLHAADIRTRRKLLPMSVHMGEN